MNAKAQYTKRILSLLSDNQHDLTGKRVLDFGCGAGDVVLGLLDAGVLANGIDILPEQVEKGRQTLIDAGYTPDLLTWLDVERTRYRTTNAYSLPYADASFDAVFAIQVVEHISDIDLVLKEWHRILRPGGIVYVEFPASYTPIEPHIKIPFAHWLPYSKWRARYIDFCYALGIGIHRESGGARQNDYLKDGVYYRLHKETEHRFAHYFRVINLAPSRVLRKLEERKLTHTPQPIQAAAAWLLDTTVERTFILEKQAE